MLDILLAEIRTEEEENPEAEDLEEEEDQAEQPLLQDQEAVPCPFVVMRACDRDGKSGE